MVAVVYNRMTVGTGDTPGEDLGRSTASHLDQDRSCQPVILVFAGAVALLLWMLMLQRSCCRETVRTSHPLQPPPIGRDPS
jgi:hypothetical protein